MRQAAVGVTVAAITFALLLALYGATVGRSQPSPSPTPQPAPVVAATQRPAPVAVGDDGQLRLDGYSDDFILWVNQTAYTAWKRAGNERDGHGRGRLFELHETLRVPSGTRVRVVERDGTAAHVEILDGTHALRRGWIDADRIAP